MSFYHPRNERPRLSLTAQGLVSEPYPGILAGAATAPATQVVYGVLLGLRAGDVVTGIVIRNTVAAVGTDPTTARFGLATSAGVMLAVSGNVNAAASWATGARQHALSAPYTITSEGAYYACYVVNGTWSATQPTPLHATSTTGYTALTGKVAPAFQWAGQTDLPAVDASLTLTASGRTYWLGVY